MSVSLLKTVYLFKSMTNDDLEKVHGISRLEVHEAGSKIFSYADTASALYIIQFGAVKIFQVLEGGSQIDIAILGNGSHFGEMSFLDGESRSANVATIEKTDMLIIDYEALRKLLATEPRMSIDFYKSLSVFLASRLRLTTTDLKFARELNLRHF